VSALAVVLAALCAGYYGTELFQNQKFARAEAVVRDAREAVARAEDLSSAFRTVGKIVEPSVVNIKVSKTVKNPHTGRPRAPVDEDFFRRFMPPGHELPERGERGGADPDATPDEDPGETMVGTGSGVIIEFDKVKKVAYIVTNNHVAGGAEEMTVVLHDGREIANGKVLGADAKTDLAVVRIEVDRVIPAQWGDSATMEKGDWVLAFGSPFGYVGSMTHGIVSALNRQAGLLGPQGYENFIQVDAPINPGNSGGPLVNLKGEVIGINAAIASRSGGFSGLGFAIPSKQAKFVYEALRDKGKVVRGWLGIGIVDVAKDKAKAEAAGFKGERGVLVEQTFPGTPAFDVLKPGDVLTGVNGKPLESVQELRNQVASMAPGTEVKLAVVRDGKNQDLAIKLGEQPDDLAALARKGAAPGIPGEVMSDALGVRVANVTPDLVERYRLGGEVKAGALITNVKQASIAQRAGLNPGDVVTRVGSKDVKSAEEFVEALKGQDLAKGVGLTVSSAEGSRLVFVQSGRPRR